MSPCPGKPFVPKSPVQEVPQEEQVMLEPELEEALANATDAEMCDIAGGSRAGLWPPPGGHEGTGGVTGHPLTPPRPAAILGMYTLMSNKQYYDAICSGNITNTEGINSEWPGEDTVGTPWGQHGDGGHGVPRAVQGDFGEQNPPRIPRGDRAHTHKRVCVPMHDDTCPCVSPRVPVCPRVPQAW